MVIFADHLDVPSKTLCFAAFVYCTKSSLEILNISWITSNTSGLFFSLIFILSFIALMIFCVLSSAPCLELFSAAPAVREKVSNFIGKVAILFLFSPLRIPANSWYCNTQRRSGFHLDNIKPFIFILCDT